MKFGLCTVLYCLAGAGFKTREILLKGTGGEELREKRSRYQSTAEPRMYVLVLKYTRGWD
jgi:hypothetical protein